MGAGTSPRSTTTTRPEVPELVGLNMQRVAIVDTGLCNVDSIARALDECGVKADITNVASDLDVADKIILPGVGAYPDAMRALNAAGLADAIRANVVQHDVPILGICLGMQLLLSSSDEVEPTAGLDLIGGSVVRLRPTSGERVPHVGWNEVHAAVDSPLLSGIPDGADFYFVHSFHAVCETAAVIATTPYCGTITTVIGNEHIVGTQFHPEKSQQYGLKLLRNFVELW